MKISPYGFNNAVHPLLLCAHCANLSHYAVTLCFSLSYPPFTRFHPYIVIPIAIAVYIFAPAVSFQTGKEPEMLWHPTLRQLQAPACEQSWQLPA